jgi:hypothetical protein
LCGKDAALDNLHYNGVARPAVSRMIHTRALPGEEEEEGVGRKSGQPAAATAVPLQLAAFFLRASSLFRSIRATCI